MFAQAREVIKQRIELVGRELAQCLALGSGYKVEESATAEGEYCGNSGRKGKADINIFDFAREQFGLVHDAFQGKHGKQRYGELCDNEYRRHRAELGIHRHIVDEEIGERHEIMPPRKQNRQYRGGEQRPFDSSLHDEKAENEEHHDERANINRSACARLFAPILPQLLIDELIHRVALLLHNLVLNHRNRRTALRVRYQQRPRLAYSVAPRGDVVALKSAVSLVGRIFLHQFALASHRLFLVFPRVIEVGNVHRNANDCGGETHSRGFQKMGNALLTDGIDKETEYEEKDDKHIIICHLHVIGADFKGRKERRYNQSPQIFAPICKHDTAYHRRQIGQCENLPQVAGGYNDKEIT